MHIHLTARIAVALTIIAITNGLVYSAAQTTAPVFRLDRRVDIELKDAALADAVRMLSDQTGNAILADGLPRRKPGKLALHGKLRDALDTLAEAYDCKWRAASDGAILVTRAFQDPNEWPQLHAPELLHAARTVLVLLPPGEADYSRGNLNDTVWAKTLVRLADALRDEQTATLRAGGRLEWTDLNREQQALLRKAISARAYGKARGAWTAVAFDLANLDRATVDVTADDAAHHDEVMLTIADRSGAKDSMYLGRLPAGVPPNRGPNGRNDALPAGPPSLDIPAPGALGASAGQRAMRDKPGAEDEALRQSAAIAPGVVSLAKLSASIASTTGWTVDLADYLREREVFVAPGALSVKQLLESVAEIDGFVWTRTGARALAASRPVPRRSQIMAQLSRSMRLALPPDVAAFLHLLDANGQGDWRHAGIQSAHARLSTAHMARERFLNLFARRATGATHVMFGDLGQDERDCILMMLLLRDYGDVAELLANDFAPHRIQPERATLSLEYGKVLVVEMAVDRERGLVVGFGKNVVDR